MSAGKIDVLAVMDASAKFIDMLAPEFRSELHEARAAVAELIVKADSAWRILANEIEANNVSSGYRPHADELRAALARIGGDA